MLHNPSEALFTQRVPAQDFLPTNMTDRTSYSRPDEAVVTHLDWEIHVDFSKNKLVSEATYTVKVLQSFVETVQLDTSHLEILGVTNPEDGADLQFKLHPEGKSYLGRRLEIQLPKLSKSTCRITIRYATTKACSALQWLPPSQTAGKKHPYLFTQCQAIHARSLVPCQDCCGVKMTYKAVVKVPKWATCVMSALLQSEESTSEGDKIFVWEQSVPISSYLLALAVGELTKITISERCAVWSEPSVVESAAFEFAETEDFLATAEAIAGKQYAWGRYDLLCLPPSFPYGGMENPCLTFVTPTLLAGDRSLADVVAHEIAHSWTGNLVTNATWDHFWLNEGWTMWLQRKIMARMKKNPKFLDFDAIDGRKDMVDTVEEFSTTAPENTCLVLDNGDSDPDDSYSTIAYEKGFTFLLYLERLVGTLAFEAFFQAYVARFASKTLTSLDFKEFFLEHFAGNAKVGEIQWETWYYAQGMPPVLPPLDQSMAKASQELANDWYDHDCGAKSAPSTNETESWASGQITCFLDALQLKTVDSPLKISTLRAMNELYKLAESRNSEILFRYCQLAIASEDETVIPVAVRFITSQGRMKYIRPLYKSLYRSKMGKEIALATFLEHKDIYHPIATKMVAVDLKVAMEESSSSSSSHNFSWSMVGAAVAMASIVFAMARRSRK